MSGRVVSDIQTRAEGESLYIRYNTDANVVNRLKNDSSYEFIGEVILKLFLSNPKRQQVSHYITSQCLYCKYLGEYLPPFKTKRTIEILSK
jgi:hypothetical protein